MPNQVKKIIEAALLENARKQLLMVSEEDFLTLKKHGGHVIFSVKEHGKNNNGKYHSLLALQVSHGDQTQLYFHVYAKHHIV